MSKAIRSAARKWWSMKRPAGWTMRDHLGQPTINCASEYEDALATAVAASFTRRKPQRTKGGEQK